MNNDYPSEAMVFPKAIYLECKDVPNWLNKKDIVIYQVIYTRELKVLIFYRDLH